MSEPIAPPGKKNPQRRTGVPQTPPQQRSRAALGLAAAAAEGRFMLQVCSACGDVGDHRRADDLLPVVGDLQIEVGADEGV